MPTIGRFRWFRPALPGLLVLTLLEGGCALLGGSSPPVDRSQDARIQQEVQARLAHEPSLETGRIRVEVTGGQVELHGSVRGLAAWRCALKNAGLVEGVRSVVDYLILERGPREATCLAPVPAVGSRTSGR